MNLIQLTDDHIDLLEEFCAICAGMGWKNNSSLDAMKFHRTIEQGGAWFGHIEGARLLSVAGCVPFPEIDPAAWRIFLRSASLPKTGITTGLHRGTGPRGRVYIDRFIEYCGRDLYVTTNLENLDYPKILRYHRALELESGSPQAYIHRVGDMIVSNTPQAVWALDIDIYRERTRT